MSLSFCPTRNAVFKSKKFWAYSFYQQVHLHNSCQISMQLILYVHISNLLNEFENQYQSSIFKKVLSLRNIDYIENCIVSAFNWTDIHETYKIGLSIIHYYKIFEYCYQVIKSKLDVIVIYRYTFMNRQYVYICILALYKVMQCVCSCYTKTIDRWMCTDY